MFHTILHLKVGDNVCQVLLVLVERHELVLVGCRGVVGPQEEEGQLALQALQRQLPAHGSPETGVVAGKPSGQEVATPKGNKGTNL